MARASLQVKNLPEFQDTLRRYVQFSRRDRKDIVNTKSLYIARRAFSETPNADKGRIKEELRVHRVKDIKLKNGRLKRVDYTLAQLIVIAHRAAKGESTKKKDIAEDVKKLIAARVRAVNFLKAGWIPAIRKFEPLALSIGGNKAPRPKSSQQAGHKGYGRAIPAQIGLKPQAFLANDALSKDKSGNFLHKIIRFFHPKNRGQVYALALPALEKAIETETASMNEYIARKMQQSADRLAIKNKLT